MKTFPSGKMKFGILHIPTGLILKEYLYAYDEDIEDPDTELLFNTKEEAQLALLFSKHMALEKKKVVFTEEERIFYSTVCDPYPASRKNKSNLVPIHRISPYIASTNTLEIQNSTQILWTPQKTIKFLSKCNLLEVYEIQKECFYRAAGLDVDTEENIDAFKKKTNYFLNIYDRYLISEFEIIEVPVNISVVRPSVSEFKDLVFRILNEAKVPLDIREKVQTFIKE